MSQRSSTGTSGKRAAPKVRRARSGRKASGVRKTGRVLHLETFSGIAGNMFLAALLDLGLSRRALEAGLAGLGLDFALRVRKVRRGVLAARHLEVRVPERKGRRGGASGGHSHGRSYLEIRRLLEGADLEAPVRTRALAIFEQLGRAEARVHGTKLEAVHFHEVGAVDAIVDITGAAFGLVALGVERVTATPVALGHGRVDTEHGTLPLPAPATLELLKGIPTVPAHVAWETVTPTGAAILRCVVDEFCQLPGMTVEAVGHGAGEDRKGPMPNLLRAVLGRNAGAQDLRAPVWERIVALETNLDDLVPEHFDYLMDRLFEGGALDVSLQLVQMKKNRPGFLVRVLARPVDRLRLAELMIAESTAIGVRTMEWDRLALQREHRQVNTDFGRIGVKVVYGAGGRAEVSAEYEDCKRAAQRTGVALREVVRIAEQVARESLD